MTPGEAPFPEVAGAKWEKWTFRGGGPRRNGRLPGGYVFSPGAAPPSRKNPLLPLVVVVIL
jgi:hypothetical protein